MTLYICWQVNKTISNIFSSGSWFYSDKNNSYSEFNLLYHICYKDPMRPYFEHDLGNSGIHVELNFNPFNHVQEVFEGVFWPHWVFVAYLLQIHITLTIGIRTIQIDFLPHIWGEKNSKLKVFGTPVLPDSLFLLHTCRMFHFL